MCQHNVRELEETIILRLLSLSVAAYMVDCEKQFTQISWMSYALVLDIYYPSDI